MSGVCIDIRELLIGMAFSKGHGPAREDFVRDNTGLEKKGL